MIEIVAADRETAIAAFSDIPAWQIETGADTPDTLWQASELFEIRIAGRAVAYYGVDIVKRPGKTIAWVTAFKGRADGIDLATLLDTIADHQCHRADLLAFQTARRGLIRRALRAGWREGETILYRETK